MDASVGASACSRGFRLSSLVITGDICSAIITTTGSGCTTDETLNFCCLPLGEFICNAGDLLG